MLRIMQPDMSRFAGASRLRRPFLSVRISRKDVASDGYRARMAQDRGKEGTWISG